MLSGAEIDIPSSVERQLQERADFSDSFAQFARVRLGGFEQPVAVAIAMIGPVLLALIYGVGGFSQMVEVATVFVVSSAIFLVGAGLAKREEMLWSYAEGLELRRQAEDDLRVGRGEHFSLTFPEPPAFFEHFDGVIVLAKAADNMTLFFDVQRGEHDARWALYASGRMESSNWSWLRLKGSGAIIDLTCEGREFAGPSDVSRSGAGDAWDAFLLALGEPHDGDLIDMPFHEAKTTLSSLV